MHHSIANDDLDQASGMSWRRYWQPIRNRFEQYGQQRWRGRLEQADRQLSAPFKQHIGVDAVLLRQVRH